MTKQDTDKFPKITLEMSQEFQFIGRSLYYQWTKEDTDKYPGSYIDGEGNLLLPAYTNITGEIEFANGSQALYFYRRGKFNLREVPGSEFNIDVRATETHICKHPAHEPSVLRFVGRLAS